MKSSLELRTEGSGRPGAGVRSAAGQRPGGSGGSTSTSSFSSFSCRRDRGAPGERDYGGVPTVRQRSAGGCGDTLGARGQGALGCRSLKSTVASEISAPQEDFHSCLSPTRKEASGRPRGGKGGWETGTARYHCHHSVPFVQASGDAVAAPYRRNPVATTCPARRHRAPR